MTDIDAVLAIKQVGSGWRTAFEARDVDAIMSFYAPEIVTFDIEPPLRLQGLEANRENWVRLFGAFDNDIRIEPADVQVIVEGAIVVVHELAQITGSKMGQPYSEWTRCTNVLRNIGGEWLIVHAHTSVPT